MTGPGERVFAWLVRLYPREFRERYRDDLLAFFRQDREDPRYGSGPLRPVRFWTATVRDLARAVASHRRAARVLRTMRGRGPESDLYPEAFIPFFQTSHPKAELLVRTDRDPTTIVPALQAAIHAAIPGDVVGQPQMLERSYAGMLEQRRFNMIILVLFGTVAVAIAAIGIYGIMSFLVAQRRREIGVRVALGALPSGILSMVLGRAMRLMVAGLVPGLAAAVLLERTARAFLFNARPHDPAIYAAVVVVLLSAGLVAAVGPARRAARPRSSRASAAPARARPLRGASRCAR
jgi:hypothetical protein